MTARPGWWDRSFAVKPWMLLTVLGLFLSTMVGITATFIAVGNWAGGQLATVVAWQTRADLRADALADVVDQIRDDVGRYGEASNALAGRVTKVEVEVAAAQQVLDDRAILAEQFIGIRDVLPVRFDTIDQRLIRIERMIGSLMGRADLSSP